MKMKFLFGAIAIFALVACNTTTTDQKNPNAATANDTVFDPQKKLNEMRERSNQPYNNKSAFLYLKTEPDNKLWFKFLMTSSWAKKIANEAYTVLLPSDAQLKEMNPKSLSILREGKDKAFIDEFLANYIFQEEIKIEKLVDEFEVTSISGKKMKVQPGANNINGAVYMMNQIFTPQGSVIYLSSLRPADKK